MYAKQIILGASMLASACLYSPNSKADEINSLEQFITNQKAKGQYEQARSVVRGLIGIVDKDIETIDFEECKDPEDLNYQNKCIEINVKFMGILLNKRSGLALKLDDLSKFRNKNYSPELIKTDSDLIRKQESYIDGLNRILKPNLFPGKEV